MDTLTESLQATLAKGSFVNRVDEGLQGCGVDRQVGNGRALVTLTRARWLPRIPNITEDRRSITDLTKMFSALHTAHGECYQNEMEHADWFK